MIDLPEYVDGLPNIAGHEKDIAEALKAAADREVFRPESRIDFARIKSAAAIALHMHQPLIPAGGHDLRTAKIISNLKYMMDNPGIGDNHNAERLRLVLQADGRVHPAARQRRQRAAGDARVLGNAPARAARDGRAPRHRRAENDHDEPRLPPLRRMARLPVGPRGGAVDAGAGLPAARPRLAAPLRRHLRDRGAAKGPRLLALGNGAAEPSRTSPTPTSRRSLDCGFTWVLVQEHTVEQPAERPRRRSRSTCRTASSSTARRARRRRSSP